MGSGEDDSEDVGVRRTQASSPVSVLMVNTPLSPSQRPLRASLTVAVSILMGINRKEGSVARELLRAYWIRRVIAFIIASATNFVWVTTAWAQGTPDGPTNQGTSLLDFILGSVVLAALIAGVISLWVFHRGHQQDRRKREEDRQQREEALLKALYAEIRAIQSDLWSYVGGIRASLEQPDNVGLRMTELFTSTEVYKSNIDSLGQISDGKLVGQITSFYADLDAIVQKAKYIPTFSREHGLPQDLVQRMVRGHYKTVAITLDRTVHLEYLLEGITNRLAQERPPTAVSSTAEQLRKDWGSDAVQLSPELEKHREMATVAWYALVEKDLDVLNEEIDKTITDTDEYIKRSNEEMARLQTEAAREPTPEEEALIEKRVDEMLERLQDEVQKEERHEAEEKEEDNSAEKLPPS
jgi:hypothetical protein